MRLDKPFDEHGVPEPQGAGTVPAGWYRVMIVGDERKNTRAGDGSWYMDIDTQIVDGPHQGRHVFTMLNLGNRSEQARDIARQQFAALIRAVGAPGPIQQTEVLHNIVVRAKVRLRKGTGDWPDRNDISAWEPDRGGSPPLRQPAPSQPPPPPGSSAAPMPQQPQSVAQPPPPPPADDFEDDIPF